MLGLCNNMRMSEHLHNASENFFQEPELLSQIREVGVAEYARKGEDAILSNQEKGLFAVFDGVGGHGNGRHASDAAARIVAEELTRAVVDVDSCKTLLRGALARANAEIAGPNRNMTTATILQLIETDNAEVHAVWASVGDTRLYIYRDEEVTSLTIDEGEGNMIHNAVGSGSNFYVRQVSSLRVKPGDIFMVCSDGITGDFEHQFLSEKELESAFSKKSAQESADEFVRLSKKNDDKSVIVVKF